MAARRAPFGRVSRLRHVITAGLAGADDQAVRGYAASKGLAVVSKDRDFRDLSVAHGAPPKAIWLRVGNGPTQVIEDLLRQRLSDATAFLADPSAALLELP